MSLLRKRSLAALAVATAGLLITSDDPAMRTSRPPLSFRTLTNRRGRPRKFSGPARALTLTLPEDTIAQLRRLDPDISKAVVKAVQQVVPMAPPPRAEVLQFGEHAVIVVVPSQALTERTGAQLVRLSDGRALIAFNSQLSVAQFELKLWDALSDGTLGAEDRETFEALGHILRDTRRRGAHAIEEQRIIVLRA